MEGGGERGSVSGLYVEVVEAGGGVSRGVIGGDGGMVMEKMVVEVVGVLVLGRR